MDTFEGYVERVKHLASDPTNDDKLKLYGLFKQSTVGDINTECPSIFNISGRAKWHAWNEQKGRSGEETKAEYIALVDRLIKELGIDIKFTYYS